MKVPFVDLKAQYAAMKEEVNASIMEVVENTAFVGGKYVDQFEKEFAAFCGRKYAVGMSSGTTALQLALLGLGVEPGDEVITAANTFIATTEAITHARCSVRLVDADARSFNIDPTLIEAAITERTRVLIPVHLYGQTADMDAIMEIAKRHDLLVLEDAAQAQGAGYKGKMAGSLGDAGSFSFYPAKNLGAYGDAGIVVTDDKAVADRIRLLSNHGRRSATDHSVEGFNERLDGIQAAVLSTKLPRLKKWNDMRREAAGRYNKLLSDLDVVTPEEMPYAKHIYHLYVIRVRERDRVREAMAEKGVGCGMHYPIPIHLLDAYKRLGKGAGSYPVTEKVASEILSLPMFPEITAEQQEYVAQSLAEVLKKVG
ncbi:MAG: DegT/DnrJ/EryC1/StrS family aminotransferase [Candidatus Eisenbacteria bacterium]